MSATPEDDVVEMRLSEAGVVLKQWTSYEFNSDFLTPTDGFSFAVGAGKLPDNVARALAPGASVELVINGSPQCTGYIDAIEVAASRDGGTEYRIEGRDALSPAVDGCMDPRFKVVPTATLVEFLADVFAPFGWKDPNTQFLVSDEANVNIITGQVRGVRSKTKPAVGKSGRKLKPAKSPNQIRLEQLRPHDGEGTFAFAARVAQRFGIWIWLSAQGNSLILGQPYFDDPPRYKLRRTRGTGTNVLTGSVRWDASEQPSFIVAEGFGGGGQWGRSKLRAICINPFVMNEEDDITQALAKFKPYESVPLSESLEESGRTLEFVSRTRTLTNSRAKPLFLHDEESHTPEQLANFVRREMSLRTRKSVTARYVVEGHAQDGVPWCINCMVDVEDEVSGLIEPMWLKSRTFSRSRSGGSTTSLELIRPYTLEF